MIQYILHYSEMGHSELNSVVNSEIVKSLIILLDNNTRTVNY